MSIHASVVTCSQASNKQQASKQASGLGVRCAFPPRVQALGGPTSSRSSPSGHLVKVGYLLNPTTNEGGGCLALPSPSQPALRGAKLHRCQWAAGGGGEGEQIGKVGTEKYAWTWLVPPQQRTCLRDSSEGSEGLVLCSVFGARPTCNFHMGQLVNRLVSPSPAR